MIHLLSTVLSTRARCGADIPSDAHPSTMPCRGERGVDRARYCAICFEVFRLDSYVRLGAVNVGPSADGYPIDKADG